MGFAVQCQTMIGKSVEGRFEIRFKICLVEYHLTIHCRCKLFDKMDKTISFLDWVWGAT